MGMRFREKALTFDDVLLVPAYSTVLPRETDLTTRLTRRIPLKLPLVSAAMDTVTDARLAIALAQEGGIGIIHKNFSPSQQAAEVLKVKRHEAGVLRDPITIPPDMRVGEVIELTRAHKFSGLPVIDAAEQVVGVITEQDLIWALRQGQRPQRIKVRKLMSKYKIFFKPDTELDAAASLLEE